MLDELKNQVLEANLAVPARNLAAHTWGNVSGFDRGSGLMVIKPSGVPYETLMPDMMVVVDLGGKIVEGKLKPSSDTPTHLELYRRFDGINGIAHTHSAWATAWAQAGKSLPCLGTTHADQFYGAVPCTRPLTEEEIQGEYELATGKVIVQCFQGLNPMQIQGVLVAQHAPFTWGESPMQAIDNSAILEELAMMAWATCFLNPHCQGIPQALLDKHFLRKHGKSAYYGQGGQ